MSHNAENDARCDGHHGPGMLRAWAECPICNPEDTSDIPPAESDGAA